MPAYSFEAIDQEGRPRKGVLEADTARSARGLLRAQALIPLSVSPVGQSEGTGTGSGSGWGALGRRRVFNATGLAVWTRQLAGLVSSGLPLERALTALTEESENAVQRELVAGLRSEVNGGSTFARALSQHPREFSPIYTAVIGAGEHSGNLGLVLDRLADDLEQRQALQQKLVGATL
ncbi:MAG: type II secretion system protein GspF, partial [Variovorax paradoxus]